MENSRIPAFPESCNGFIISGMSLRDYFAAKAMQSLIAKMFPDFNDDKDIANWAYEFADAMLKEREK